MVQVLRPRERGHQTLKSSVHLYAIPTAAIGFVAIWGIVLWQTHSSLMNIAVGFLGSHQQPWPRSKCPLAANAPLPELTENKSGPRPEIYQKSTSSIPFYGWQPLIPEEMTCSWRQCFKTDHECPTCRDATTDFGTAPVPPDDWIPDVTMLHRMMLDGKDADGRPWPPGLDKELCEDIGGQGGNMDGNKELLEKVPITVKVLLPSEKTPKIMCIVYTMEANHATNIRAMRETWAPHCDGFLAFSTTSDPRIPAISLSHDGPEEYSNMWQKVRSIWKFVGTHYLEDFDFFFQGGEDLFVIPQNLKRYLQRMLDDASATPEEDFFVGRRFKGYGENNYFNSGGAGYALSRGTLRKYVTEGWDHPKCSPQRHTAMEDVMMADCLRNVFEIGLTDSRDDEQRERFHPFAPQSHYQWRPPGEGNKDWYFDYNMEWPPLLNEMCCSPESVSFHYIKKPAMVRHLYALLNTCHENL